MWDPTKPDFEDDGEEVHIYNNTTIIAPILVGNHWAACEIQRNGDRASVVFVQLQEVRKS